MAASTRVNGTFILTNATAVAFKSGAMGVYMKVTGRMTKLMVEED